MPREYSSISSGMTLEHFEPDLPGLLPTVWVVHGAQAFWRGGEWYHTVCRMLADNGYAAILPHYMEPTGIDHADSASIRQHFRDWRGALRDAVRETVQTAPVDPQRVALVGVSLGAFLSISLAGGWEDIPLKAVIAWSGGLTQRLPPRMARMPPVLILHGDADAVVPVAEAHHLQETLQQLNVRHEIHIYANQGHKLTGESLDDALTRSLVFLRRYL